MKKFNIILIIITVVSLATTIFVLFDKGKFNQDKVDEVQFASEPTISSEDSSPEIVDEEESFNEEEQVFSQNPFEDSLDSYETGEFAKSMLKEHFLYETSKRGGTVYEPFKNKVRSIPDTIDLIKYGTGYGQTVPPKEIQKILDTPFTFTYEAIEPVIDNFEFVNCTKDVSNSSQILYICKFILPSMDGTGLNHIGNRTPNNFTVGFIKEPNGYRLGFIR